MRRAFVDAVYLLALLLPREAHHGVATRHFRSLDGVELITSDAVLFEVLNRMSRGGPATRTRAAEFVQEIIEPGGRFTVLYTTPEQIHAAVDLYARRPDQRYSVVDCLSMTMMDENGIATVLTFDRDFHGERRFTVLPAPL